MSGPPPISVPDLLAHLREMHAEEIAKSVAARDRRDQPGAYYAQQEASRLAIRIRDLEFPSTVPESRR